MAVLCKAFVRLLTFIILKWVDLLLQALHNYSIPPWDFVMYMNSNNISLQALQIYEFLNALQRNIRNPLALWKLSFSISMLLMYCCQSGMMDCIGLPFVWVAFIWDLMLLWYKFVLMVGKSWSSLHCCVSWGWKRVLIQDDEIKAGARRYNVFFFTSMFYDTCLIEEWRASLYVADMLQNHPRAGDVGNFDFYLHLRSQNVTGFHFARGHDS